VTEREAYIALNMLPGVGPVSVRNLAQALGSAAAIFSAPGDELLRVPGVGRELGARLTAARASSAAGSAPPRRRARRGWGRAS